MAAWFAMLILLVGVLLTAAAKISKPEWIPSFLAISAVGISTLVIVAVFLMLTTFRPHLQEAKEYSEWLKDERRFVVQTVQTLEIVKASGDRLAPEEPEHVGRKRRLVGLARASVSISYLEHADDVLGVLHQLGFNASIYYFEDDPNPRNLLESSDHQAIWVGSRVSPRVAISAIKTVIKVWPHLRYLLLSGDNSAPPAYIHAQMFFGGSTLTAERFGLKPWSTAEINELPDDVDVRTFHEIIRRKYSQSHSS